MFTRPSDLSDDAVAEALRSGWGIRVDALDYAAVGFGSHHWRAASASARWFLTVDDLDARPLNRSDSRSATRARLDAALSTALSLRSSGCQFVVAPIPSRSGHVVESIDERYVLAVYPHVDGVTGSFGPFDDRSDRLAVVDLLVRLHGTDIPVPARTTDFAVPVGTGSVRPWPSGPSRGRPARSPSLLATFFDSTTNRCSGRLPPTTTSSMESVRR